MLALVAIGAAALAVAEPSAPVGQRLRADAPSLLALGRRLQDDGAEAEAATVYAALEADPSADVRAEARYRLAGLAMRRKEWQAAAIFLRRVLDERPDAAPVRLTLAQVLNEIGDEGAALRELRAAQAIGLPLEVARMVDRFSEALRARRPFGASLEIALAPDSNINAATSSDTLGTVIGEFDIDPGGKARSGVGAALRGSAFARKPLGETVALLARANVSADFYRDKDFNQITADLSAGPELHLGPVRLNLEAGATRRWFGMKPFEDSLRLDLSAALPAGRRSLVRGRIAVARIDNKLNDLQDGRLWSGEIGIERAIDARTGLGLSLAASRAALDDPGYSTTAWRATLLGWREFGRVTAHASASIGRLEADERLSLFPDKREDRSWRLSAGATMRQFQWGGFAPLVRVSYERNASTIAFYDTRRRRVEFGFVRAF
ncbi:surface lipoprotein assembly modifier [Sphingomonas mesophila]|uniref:surface lipoprotein assembly modifier n=1 Tax=Sphingomonas mesophila TaxID=2303576 RepID=UPI000E57E159|nr:surface lipoprotein assembly modifier [Sphingomonas mesophila]